VRNKANPPPGAGDCGLLISDCGLKDARASASHAIQAWAGMRNKANAAGDKQTVNIVKERS